MSKARPIISRATGRFTAELEFKFKHYNFFPISEDEFNAHKDLIEKMAEEKLFDIGPLDKGFYTPTKQPEPIVPDTTLDQPTDS